jgi:hypothetical protein
VRCRNFEPALDVAGYDGVEMRVKVGVKKLSRSCL